MVTKKAAAISLIPLILLMSGILFYAKWEAEMQTKPIEGGQITTHSSIK